VTETRELVSDIGERLELLELGADHGARPPIVLVHGAGLGAWCWEPNWMPFLAERGWHVYALSLRGHGASDGDHRKLRVRHYLDDVRLALRHVGSPAVVGHSLGGYVIQQLVHETDLPAAVLIASVPAAGNRARDWWPGLRSLGRDAVRTARAVPSRRRREQLFHEMGQQWFFTPETPIEHVATVAAQMKVMSPRLLLGDLRKPVPDRRRPSTPMLVVAGEGDRTIPVIRQEATAKRYSADFVVAPSVGHNIPVEHDWRPTAETVEQWLRATLDPSAETTSRAERPLTTAPRRRQVT
jgi:pimeloyl-ACP methyl ester carboxylesterase